MEQVTEALRTAHSPTAPEQLRAQALQVGWWDLLVGAACVPFPYGAMDPADEPCAHPFFS